MNTHPPSIWVLRDDRAGHNAQSHGLAHRFGVPYSIKPIEYNRFARLPNRLIGSSLRGLTEASKAQVVPPWPKLVIAAGRRIVPVAQYIKKQSPDTILLQLMWPGHVAPFDLIIVPKHDHPPEDPRIITTVGALHAVTDSILEMEAEKLEAICATLPRPIVLVLIGGNSKHGTFERSDIERLLDLSELLTGGTGSLFISTSRRSPSFVESICKARITCPYHLYKWGSKEANPYPGMLKLADAIVVTGDSISMSSEACYSGKPVYLFNPLSLESDKHRHFQNSLLGDGYAKALTPNASLEWKPEKRLDEISRIVTLIKSRKSK